MDSIVFFICKYIKNIGMIDIIMIEIVIFLKPNQKFPCLYSEGGIYDACTRYKKS